ncbi:MAG: ABC transporter permease [Candidatus Cloacimonetes bacterium]|nr:ABC transporter permease [Candidatus Cloacimonadota bacterium]
MKLYGFYLSRSVISRKNRKIRFDIWFSALGIIIAVMTLTTALSLFDGYTNTLKKSILNAYSHILIYPNISDTLNDEEIVSLTAYLNEKEEVGGFAEVSAKQSMITFDGKRIRGSYLKGIRMVNPGYQEHLNRIVDSHNSELSSGEIILGHILARELGVSIGDTIRVINPQSENVSVFGLKNNEIKLKIVDLYRSGMYEQDNSVGLLTKEDFDNFYKDTGVSDWIEVVLKSGFEDKAEKLTSLWSKEVFNDFQILPWSYFNSTLFSLLEWQKGLLFVIMLFLVLIASFNLISSISASILDRRAEIGIMKAVGCSNAVLKRIHIANYIGLAIVSITGGIIAGLGLAYLITKQTILGISGDVYFIDKLTMQVKPIAILAIFVFSLIIIICSTLFPLRQINRMEVNEILRERN